MSSARSIATTIQRRAGDQSNQRSVNPYQSQPVTVKSKTYPYQQNNAPQGFVPQVKQQLTISEAIGLITIRLSKLEEQSNEAQYNHVQYDNNNNNNNNNNVAVETEVINGILSRLDLLETNVKACLKLESELRDTKDILVKIMFKIENQHLETTSSIEKLNSHHLEANLRIEKLSCQCIEQNNFSQQIKTAHETFVTETKTSIVTITEQCDNRVKTLNETLEALDTKTAVKFDNLTFHPVETICKPSDDTVAVPDNSIDIVSHTICLEE